MPEVNTAPKWEDLIDPETDFYYSAQIGEVARIVHFLKKHAVGRTVKAVKAQDDAIVYGKVGCSATKFQDSVTGKKIVDAKQQGKYFWLELDSMPHPVRSPSLSFTPKI